MCSSDLLLLVESSSGARMTGAHDVTCLDFKIRNRIRTGPVGQHEIAIDLIRFRADRIRTDEHVTNPYCVGIITLQRTLVGHIGPAVRSVVVHEKPVFVMLAGVGEKHAECIDPAARTVVLGRADKTHDITAEGDDDVLHVRVATDPDVVLTG